METRRWTNPSQPQTLYIATFLLYANAILSLVFAFGPITVVLAAGEALGGFGIANEKRWGYILSVCIALLGLVPLVLVIMHNGLTSILHLDVLFYAIFPVALFALLIHPMSREYQKIWFR